MAFRRAGRLLTGEEELDASGEAIFSLRDVSRSFGATQALVSASLEVRRGEIHALLGENGSGKSTLVKLVAGVLPPDHGSLACGGQEVRFRSPRPAQARGIAAVFQETLVVRELSVVDNVLLGTDGLLRRRYRRQEGRRRAERALHRLGIGGIGLDTPMWRLSLSQQQLVTVARALSRPWELLLLDEATSALDVESRDQLFAVLEEERQAGHSVLFISHRMEEIQRVADRVTVMRSGHVIETLAMADASTDVLLRLMAPPTVKTGAVGDGENRSGARRRRRSNEGVPVLKVRNMILRADARPFDLVVESGEVVGLAGLEGHGQVEALQRLGGHGKVSGGHVELAVGRGGWREVITPRQAFRLGVAYVPGSRKDEGLFAPLTVLDNLLLPTLGKHLRGGILRRSAMKRTAAGLVEELRVRPANINVAVGSLSGGNQQKVLLGRWVAANPRVLLLNDPLRGVDAGAKLEIGGLFVELAERGVGIVLFSTEIEELLVWCDRVAVFREQTIASMLQGEQLTQEQIMAGMFGQRDEEPASEDRSDAQ